MLQEARENYYWFKTIEAWWGRAVSSKVERCSAPHGASMPAQDVCQSLTQLKKFPTRCPWTPNGASVWLDEQKLQLGRVWEETGADKHHSPDKHHCHDCMWSHPYCPWILGKLSPCWIQGGSYIFLFSLFFSSLFLPFFFLISSSWNLSNLRWVDRAF